MIPIGIVIKEMCGRNDLSSWRYISKQSKNSCEELVLMLVAAVCRLHVLLLNSLESIVFAASEHRN